MQQRTSRPSFPENAADLWKCNPLNLHNEALEDNLKNTPALIVLFLDPKPKILYLEDGCSATDSG